MPGHFSNYHAEKSGQKQRFMCFITQMYSKAQEHLSLSFTSHISKVKLWQLRGTSVTAQMQSDEMDWVSE